MPWMESMKSKGCEFLEDKVVTDFTFDKETGSITEVVCGRQKYGADAFILAVGISPLQNLIRNRYGTTYVFQFVSKYILNIYY